MPRKDNEILFDTPSLTLDKDDVYAKQQQIASPSLLFIRVVLLVLLAFCAGMLWLLMDYKMQLDETNTQLKQLKIVIYEQESRLTVVDSASNESSAEVSEQLKFMDKEIRKLWDNVWAKNKIKLAEFAKLSKQQNEQILAIKDELLVYSDQLKKQQQTSNELKTQLVGAVNSHHTAQKELIEQFTTASSNAKQQRQALQLEQQNLIKKMEEFNDSSLAIQQKIQSHTARLDAIDTFRKLANGEINELKNRLTN